MRQATLRVRCVKDIWRTTSNWLLVHVREHVLVAMGVAVGHVWAGQVAAEKILVVEV
jgi:hypothetical protein